MADGVVMSTPGPRGCVDLRATYGRRFRYGWDPAYAEERPDLRSSEAAWLTVIPCRSGHIFPWGGRRLAAFCAGGAVRRTALAQLPAVAVAQGGAGCPDVVVTFDAADLDAVAGLMGAKCPRRLSVEHRARLLAASAPFRFGTSPADNGRSGRPDSTIGTPAGLG